MGYYGGGALRGGVVGGIATGEQQSRAMNMGNVAAQAAQKDPGHEIDREMSRLCDMNSALAECVEVLRHRLERVVYQTPASAVDANRVAPPPCSSGLGGEICTQTERLAMSVQSLHALIDSLAI